MADTFSYIDEATDFEPSEAYSHLRAQCPLHRVTDHEPPFFVVSRFSDVVGVLKQPDLWENRDGPGVFYQEAGVLGSADNPDHARHRRILQPAFLPTAIARLEPKRHGRGRRAVRPHPARRRGRLRRAVRGTVPGHRHRRAARRRPRTRTTSTTGA